MCKCTPSIRTPFCGKPGCVWPGKESDTDKHDATRYRKLRAFLIATRPEHYGAIDGKDFDARVDALEGELK